MRARGAHPEQPPVENFQSRARQLTPSAVGRTMSEEGVHRAVVQAVEYAKTLSQDVRAIYVNVDPTTTEHLHHDWEQWGQGVPLVVLDSPFRSLMEPFLEYLEQIDMQRPDDFVTVVLPEFVP